MLIADDATGSGTLENVMQWWDELSLSGPAFGYFPNAKKLLANYKTQKGRGSESGLWSDSN